MEPDGVRPVCAVGQRKHFLELSFQVSNLEQKSSIEGVSWGRLGSFSFCDLRERVAGRPLVEVTRAEETGQTQDSAAIEYIMGEIQYRTQQASANKASL